VRAAARPGKRAKLPGAIAKAECHAGHSREASTAFSEACTAFLRIMSRICANAFEHFRRVASQFIAMPARYEIPDLAHIASRHRRCINQPATFSTVSARTGHWKP
jgi:hypothetical protein